MRLRRLAYWSNYTLVSWQLVLCAFLFWMSWYGLKKQYGKDPEELVWIVMHLFFLIIGWVVLFLFSFSLITVFLAWLHFIYRVKQKKIEFKIQIGTVEKVEAGMVSVAVLLNGVLRPFLGSVRARVVFSDYKMSNPIILDENIYRKNSIIRKLIRGTAMADLHDRGIYDVEEVQLQFCDMFRLFGIPYTLLARQQFYTLPQIQKEKAVVAQPNTTEEQTERIEIPKPSEGEYINYKDFETGDDVRRIVWKIYARNGQLVVRIPETKDPYASHLYFYASFFADVTVALNGIFEREILNSYKDKVRNIFEALQQNGFEVKIQYDQELQKISGMGDAKNELFHISAAHWQNENIPSELISSSKAAFVCLSAFSSAAEVQKVIERLPEQTPIVVVRLSDAIGSPFNFSIRNLFFVPEKTAADELRRPWLIAPLRTRLIINERAILKLLTKRGNSWIISANESV